jgi:hypothetical protein
VRARVEGGVIVLTVALPAVAVVSLYRERAFWPRREEGTNVSEHTAAESSG